MTAPVEAYAPPPTVVTPPASVQPAAPVAPARPVDRAPLQLSLTESQDEGDDQRRLGAVFRLLQSQPGPDAVLLTIHTRDGETVQLSLPSARLDDALRERLREALEGAAAVPYAT